jgi:hypothetical protein
MCGLSQHVVASERLLQRLFGGASVAIVRQMWGGKKAECGGPEVKRLPRRLTPARNDNHGGCGPPRPPRCTAKCSAHSAQSAPSPLDALPADVIN